eukprot:COSAG02_NODE_517_length_20800_cov_18.817497_9_plen_200_part_00
MLCFATVVGIVVMSLLVADLDRPFHGCMVIDLHSLVDVVTLLDHACLRHSKSTIGRRKMSILACHHAPQWTGSGSPLGQRNGHDTDTSASSSAAVHWGALKRRFKSKSSVESEYRAEVDMSAAMAMKRLRSDSYGASQSKHSGEAGGLDKLEEGDESDESDDENRQDDYQHNQGGATTYEDLDEMEAEVLGRPGSLLMP